MKNKASLNDRPRNISLYPLAYCSMIFVCAGYISTHSQLGQALKSDWDDLKQSETIWNSSKLLGCFAQQKKMMHQMAHSVNPRSDTFENWQSDFDIPPTLIQYPKLATSGQLNIHHWWFSTFNRNPPFRGCTSQPRFFQYQRVRTETLNKNSPGVIQPEHNRLENRLIHHLFGSSYMNQGFFWSSRHANRNIPRMLSDRSDEILLQLNMFNSTTTLVGGWGKSPLKNMSSSIGMISNPIFLGK